MMHDPHGYRLPVGYRDSPFIGPRARTRRLYGKRGNQVVTGNRRVLLAQRSSAAGAGTVAPHVCFVRRREYRRKES